MTIRFNKFILFAFTVLLGPVAAHATPTLDSVGGHHYEVIADAGITWQGARDAIALLPPYAGVTGHLATITSADEAAFVESLRPTGAWEAWLGGFQDPLATMSAEDNWTWVNGEGTFPGNNVDTGFENDYANWLGNEPNDAYGPATEQHLTTGLTSNSAWNDEGVTVTTGVTNIEGYVVEYDTRIEIDAEDCADPGGCELPGTTLIFPPSADVEGAVITVQSFEFDDDPARCGVESLVLFGVDRPELNIPAWLCGSPKILILALDTSQVDFPDGVILVENDSPLPGNVYSCDSPNIPVGSDLRHQDVLGWQSTEFGDMVEDRYHVPAKNPDPEFADLAVPFPVGGPTLGHMGEYSDGCGSTRGRVRGGSYFGIGLHIHPIGTPDEGAESSPDITLFQINRITRYKLALLQFSILESEPPVLGRNDFRYMKKQVAQAIKQMNKSNFKAARAHVQNIERRAERAVYGTGGTGHENGEHLSRSANIIFMLDQKSSLP